MKFPPLYKIGSKGETRVWSIKVDDCGDHSIIYTSYGVLDGKMQGAKEEVRVGKNIGKANQTSHNYQAISQAQSTWKKKLDDYYAETVDEATKLQLKSTRPMKAHVLEEKRHTLTPGQDIYYQPKLDGMRSLAVKKNNEVTLLTKSGATVTALPHINEELNKLMNDDEIWDGELYSPLLDFETIMSLCKPKKPKPDAYKISMYVFDVVAKKTLKERYIDNVYKRLIETTTPLVSVVPVETMETIYQEEHSDEMMKYYMTLGYEGAMLRVPSQPTYEHKKTKYLLKHKEFIDAEYKIIGFKTGTPGTKTDGLLATFKFEYTNNKGELDDFDSAPLGSYEKLVEMWKNRDSYVGQMGTVKYQDLTKLGAPRFGKVKSIRPEIDMDPKDE